VLEHVLQRVDVRVLEGLERLVERGADVGLEVADSVPAASSGTQKVYLSGFSSCLASAPAGIPFALRFFASCSCSWSKRSESLFRKSMPKMYSLYSEASMLPRRSSQARNSRPESWLSVSFVIAWAPSRPD
jgi:hypothetical protein